MKPEDYKIRCDKHAFHPYEYCEMCMVRNLLQQSIEKNREETQRMIAQTSLAIHVIHDSIDNIRKKIDNITMRMEAIIHAEEREVKQNKTAEH